MADKTVVVRLRAVVDQYKSAMRDASGATKSLASEASTAFNNLSGKKMAQIGGTLTRNVTLPLIGIGVAAGKLAVDFDDVFGRMQGLAGVAADDVDGLKDSVLDLAGETGQAPQELAEALYFIRSAGIDGAVAMETLEVSAKGAAAGLGSAASVADLVTSVLGAYGEEAISAAEAGDILAATAREGKAEAAALAPQMGRLLPVASELGVEFEELGGFMAFFSRSGGGAELAATNLSNVLAKMLNPAQEGREALDDIGTSVQGLRERVGRDGLVQTLQWLREQLEANGMEFGDFSRDVQFTNGALAVTGENFQAAMEVMGAVEDSTGTLDNAFSRMADTLGFKNKQAFADLQASLIQLGDKVVPIFSELLGLVADVVGMFADLPGPVQTGVLALLGIAAAAGPILTLTGNLKKMNTTLAGMGPAGTKASAALGWASKAGAAAAGVFIFAQAADALRDKLDPLKKANLAEFTNSLLDFNDTGRLSGEAADILGEDFGKLRDAFDRITDPSIVDRASDVAEEITTLGGVFGRGMNDDLEESHQLFKDLDTVLTDLSTQQAGSELELLGAAAEALGVDVDMLVREHLPQYRGALAEADTQQRLAGDGANSLAEDVDGVTTAYDQAVAALGEYADELAALFDPLFAVTDSLQDVEEAQLAYNEAVAQYGPHSAEAEAATIGVARAIQGLDGDLATLLHKIETGEVSIDEARATLANWATSYGLTADQVATLNALFQGNIDLANQIHGRRIVQTVETHYMATGAIGPNTPFIPSPSSQTPYMHEGGWVMGSPGADVPAILQVGEYVLTADEAARLRGLLPGGRMSSDKLEGLSHGGSSAGGSPPAQVRPIIVRVELSRRNVSQAVIDDWNERRTSIPVRVDVARRVG